MIKYSTGFFCTVKNRDVKTIEYFYTCLFSWWFMKSFLNKIKAHGMECIRLLDVRGEIKNKGDSFNKKTTIRDSKVFIS